MQIEKNDDKLVKTLRVFIQDQPGYLGRLCTAIGEAGGNIGEVETVGLGLVRNTRDLTVYVDGAINLEDVAAPDCFEIEARIQNALAFPGIFRGALDARARWITDAIMRNAKCGMRNRRGNQERTKVRKYKRTLGGRTFVPSCIRTHISFPIPHFAFERRR